MRLNIEVDYGIEIPVKDRKSFIAPFGKSETYRASEVKDPSLLESLVGSGDILFVQSPLRLIKLHQYPSWVVGNFEDSDSATKYSAGLTRMHANLKEID